MGLELLTLGNVFVGHSSEGIVNLGLSAQGRATRATNRKHWIFIVS